jgi:hypothetical protein
VIGEDTSSPVPVFVATERDISAGQTVSFRLPAPLPGVYNGTIVLGEGGAPPYPVYTYSPGPLVGRVRIRVRQMSCSTSSAMYWARERLGRPSRWLSAIAAVSARNRQAMRVLRPCSVRAPWRSRVRMSLAVQ